MPGSLCVSYASLTGTPSDIPTPTSRLVPFPTPTPKPEPAPAATPTRWHRASSRRNRDGVEQGNGEGPFGKCGKKLFLARERPVAIMQAERGLLLRAAETPRSGVHRLVRSASRLPPRSWGSLLSLPDAWTSLTGKIRRPKNDVSRSGSDLKLIINIYREQDADTR